MASESSSESSTSTSSTEDTSSSVPSASSSTESEKVQPNKKKISDSDYEDELHEEEEKEVHAQEETEGILSAEENEPLNNVVKPNKRKVSEAISKQGKKKKRQSLRLKEAKPNDETRSKRNAERKSKQQEVEKKEIRAKRKEDPQFQKSEMKVKKEDKDHHSSFMAYRCTLSSLVNLFDELKKKNLLKTIHLQAIRNTSFASFFEMFIQQKMRENIKRKHYQALDIIIQSFIPSEDAFLMGEGTRKITFSPEFIAVIFGLPMTGRVIDISGKWSTPTEFEEKFFGDRKCSITKKVVEKLILAQVEKEEEKEAEDFVKLLLIYAWATFFDAQAGGTVPRIMSQVSSIENKNNISWPKIIHSLLSKSLTKHSPHPRSVSGCVYILLYMITEYTHLGQKFAEIHEDLPRASRWNIELFFDKSYHQKFASMKNEDVKTELENLSAQEKKLMTINVEELQEEIQVLDVKALVSKRKLDQTSFEKQMEDLDKETLNVVKNSFEEENKKLKAAIEKIIQEKEETIKEREQSQVLLEAMEVEREKLTALMDKITKQKEDVDKKLEEALNLLQQKNSDDMVKSLKEENVKLQSENESLRKQLQENKVEMEKLVNKRKKLWKTSQPEKQISV